MANKPFTSRIVWFVGIWAASVAALGIVAEVLHWAMKV